MALENRRFLSQLPPPSPHLRGGKEGGDSAAAGAGFSPGTLLSLLSFSSSAGRRRPPPAPSSRSPGPGGERKGCRGAGEDGGRARARRKLLRYPFVPSPRVHPGRASAAAAAPPAAAGRRSGGGGAAGAGPAVPALSCAARLLPTLFLSPSLFGPSSVLSTPEPLIPHLLGEEDTPALVEKTFPADSVGVAVAGSPDSDLFSACLAHPAGCGR